MTPSKTSALGPELSPLSLIRMIWKHLLLMGVVFVVLAATALVVVHRLPAIFYSEAVILVDSQKIPERFVSSTVSTDVQDRLATISQQILSSTRLKNIIDDFDLYREQRKTRVQEEILQTLRNDISIKLERGWTGNRPGAFRVGYEGPDPAIVAQVANRLANLFIEENLRTREIQAEGTAEFIESQLSEAKKQLDQLETAVSQYKMQHNGELPQQESNLAAIVARMQMQLQSNRETVTRLQQGRMMIENTLSIAESTADALRRSAGERVETPAASGASAPGSDKPAQKALKRSDLLRARLNDLRVRYSSEHPDVKRTELDLARIVELEKQEKSETEAAQGSAPTEAGARPDATPRSAEPATRPAEGPRKESPEVIQARERTAVLRAQIAAIDKDLEMRKREEQQLQAEVHTYQSRMDRLPVREQEMAGLTRDYELAKASYKSLQDKKLAANMSTEMERRQKSERFTIVDPARVPEKPVKPNRVLFGTVGCVIALGIALLSGVGREIRKGHFLGEWELPPDIPVLARLPRIDASATLAASGRFRRRFPAWAIYSACGLVVAAVAGGGAYIFWIRL